MLHRVRLAMHNKDFVQLGGKGGSRVDETFIGGALASCTQTAARKSSLSAELKTSPLFFGILERGGEFAPT